MLYFMGNNPILSLDRIGDTVIMRGESDHLWTYISSGSTKDLKAAKQTLTEKDKYFAIIEDWMIPILTTDREMEWQMTMMKLILPDDVIFPDENMTPIQSLSPDDANYLYSHSIYKDATSPNYFRDRIQRGPSAGIYQSGKPVAWAMTHDDLAIGSLHVLEEYRGKGYAYDVSVNMIHQLRKDGKIPFVHIDEKNIKSINLAKKMGFQEYGIIHWFELV